VGELLVLRDPDIDGNEHPLHSRDLRGLIDLHIRRKLENEIVLRGTIRVE
jgi:hypothetical protein